MVPFGVILLIVGAVLLAFGVVVFGNGRRSRDESAPLPVKDLFSTMGSSVKVFTSREASHNDRLKAGGAFLVLTGIVVVCLAILAFIAALA